MIDGVVCCVAPGVSVDFCNPCRVVAVVDEGLSVVADIIRHGLDGEVDECGVVLNDILGVVRHPLRVFL